MKELFRSTAENAAELESFRSSKVEMFSNVGPGYYGELDEEDGQLVAFEQAAELEGESCCLSFILWDVIC